MLSFAPLSLLLQQKGINKTTLKADKVLNGGTYTIIAKAMTIPINEGVSISAINAICKYLNCQPGDILEYVPDEDN